VLYEALVEGQLLHIKKLSKPGEGDKKVPLASGGGGDEVPSSNSSHVHFVIQCVYTGCTLEKVIDTPNNFPIAVFFTDVIVPNHFSAGKVLEEAHWVGVKFAQVLCGGGGVVGTMVKLGEDTIDLPCKQ
jgi:hypothetical protein